MKALYLLKFGITFGTWEAALTSMQLIKLQRLGTWWSICLLDNSQNKERHRRFMFKLAASAKMHWLERTMRFSTLRRVKAIIRFRRYQWTLLLIKSSASTLNFVRALLLAAHLSLNHSALSSFRELPLQVMFTDLEIQATFKARQSSWLKMLMGLNSSTMMVSDSLLAMMMESACSLWHSPHCRALSSDSERTFK